MFSSKVQVRGLIFVLSVFVDILLAILVFGQGAAQEDGTWQVMDATVGESTPVCFIPSPSMKNLNTIVEADLLVSRPYLVLAVYTRGASAGIWEASNQANLFGAVPGYYENAQIVYKVSSARDLMVSAGGMAQLCLYTEMSYSLIISNPAVFMRDARWYTKDEGTGYRHEQLEPSDDQLVCWFSGFCSDCYVFTDETPAITMPGGHFATFLTGEWDNVWFTKGSSDPLATFNYNNRGKGNVGVFSAEGDITVHTYLQDGDMVTVCKMADLSLQSIESTPSVFVRGAGVIWGYVSYANPVDPVNYSAEDPSNAVLDDWFGWGIFQHLYLPMVLNNVGQ